MQALSGITENRMASYWYVSFEGETAPTDSDLDHVAKMIIEGLREGELVSDYEEEDNGV